MKEDGDIIFFICVVKTQLRLEAFYTFNERFAKIRSKRIKKAVKGIAGTQSSELVDDAAQKVSRSRKKRTTSTDEAGNNKSEKLSEGTDKSVLKKQSDSKGKSTAKQSRKRRTTEEPAPSKRPKPAEAGRSTNRKLHANGNDRGRGRRILGSGKEKVNPNFEVSETSSGNGDDDNDGMDLHTDTIEGLGEMRRVSFTFFKFENLYHFKESNVCLFLLSISLTSFVLLAFMFSVWASAEACKLHSR